MAKVIISSDKLIDKIVSAYDHQDQATIEVQHGQHLLFVDCRFVHNSYTDNLIHDSGCPTEVTKLCNFYIYEATLYKDGEFVPEKEWDFDSNLQEAENEIFQRLK